MWGFESTAILPSIIIISAEEMLGRLCVDIRRQESSILIEAGKPLFFLK